MSLKNLPEKPNIVIFLNDQDSATVAKRNPPEFEKKYMVATENLKNYGLTFNNAFIASAACSPSRGCLLTGTFPQESGVLHTLGAIARDNRVNEAPVPASFSQEALSPSRLNLAHMLKAAGYKVYWKGKWHLSSPISGSNTYTEADIRHMRDAYGFDGWNPSDGGITKKDPHLFGRGLCLHDIRYIEGNNNPEVRDCLDSGVCHTDEVHGEGVLEFIEKYNPKDGPFCLVVSLVNPHDIHVAPHFEPEAGYDENEFKLEDFDLPIPENVDEDLSTKPEVHEIRKESSKVIDASVCAKLKQRAMQKSTDAKIAMLEGKTDEAMLREKEHDELIKKSQRSLFPVPESTEDSDIINKNIQESRQLYVNSYGYFRSVVEAQFQQVLDAMTAKGLIDNTLIVRTADHGEMCLAHGQREKNYFAYDEVMNVPFIFSNPRLFPKPKETNVLASAVDLMPTLARIVGVYDTFKYAFRGSDLTPLFEDPQAKIYLSYDKDKEREFIHYASDDGFLPERFQYTPIYLRGIRSHEWKYVVYFNRLGNKFEYELYNLKEDPKENNNLIGPGRYSETQKELHNQLLEEMIKMGTVPYPYWIYTEETQKTGFVPPQYWPTAVEALLTGKMQYEANKAEEKFRNTGQLASQISGDLWWIG
ncbi:MAG: sulfatase-like hydrolase/transferase [Trichodesmium sp. St19_bin1]|nr:sulfatase-like hydrolase/transferase [Trichodesmium sp. St19_bin1]